MRCKADYRPTPCLSVSLTDLPHLLVRQIWNVKPSFKTGDFQGSDGQKPAKRRHFQVVIASNSLIYINAIYNPQNIYQHSPLDTRMNIKKLIATVVFALGAWMSVGAQAQVTIYQGTGLTETSALPSFVSGGTLYNLSNIPVGTYSNYDFSVGMTLSSPGSSITAANDGYLNTQGSAVLNSYDASGFQFIFASPISAIAFNWGAPNSNWTFNAYGASNNFIGSASTTSFTTNANSGNYVGIAGADISRITFAPNSGKDQIVIDNIVVQSGAPEIDGSLAPKVGFLLGCLFLMFGRKKQISEPMMTA